MVADGGFTVKLRGCFKGNWGGESPLVGLWHLQLFAL